MWWRRSWFSLKGKAGIPGQTEGRPATSIGPRVPPLGSLQQRAAQRTAATPPLEGADPAPRWTLKRLMLFVRERFGYLCCRETIRAALHRLKLSWKKAKKLRGRADPEQRQAFVEQLQGVLDGAQHDRHLLVYVDEAHIHQDADLGYGWAERGQRFWVASRSPGLSARVSFYGLYLYNVSVTADP